MTLRTDITADTAQGDPDYEHHEQHNEANTAILDQEERLAAVEEGGGPVDAVDVTTDGATPSNVQAELDDHDDRIVTLEDAPAPVVDHGGLTGLADDDHSQYHNDARGDARYWPLTTDLATQVELDAHLADTADAHDASAVSTSGATPSNVQAVLDDHDDRILTVGDTANAALVAHEADDEAHAPAFDTFAQSLLQVSPAFLSDWMLLYDDFLSSNVTSTQIGSLGWSSGLLGTGVVVAPTVDLGALGYLNLVAQTTNDVVILFLGIPVVVGAPAFTWSSRFLCNSYTNSRFHNGVWDYNPFATDPDNGAWFQTDSTVSGNLFARSRNAGGTIEETNLGAAPSSWNTYQITCDGGGTLTFTLNGTDVATHSTVPAATSLLSPAAMAQSKTTANKVIRLDWVYLLVAR